MNSQYQLDQRIEIKMKEAPKYTYLVDQFQTGDKNNDYHHSYFQEYEKYRAKDLIGVQEVQEFQFPSFQVQPRDQDTMESLKNDNQELRKELQSSRKQVQSLKFQICDLQTEINELKLKIDQKKGQAAQKQNFITQELDLIAHKNRMIDEQLHQLRSILKSNNFDRESILTERSFRNNPGYIYQKPSKQTPKQHQFINSIRQMYQTINGNSTKDIHQLWRWLKQMAHTFSQLNKWKYKVNQLFSSRSIRSQKMMTLLQQGIKL